MKTFNLALVACVVHVIQAGSCKKKFQRFYTNRDWQMKDFNLALLACVSVRYKLKQKFIGFTSIEMADESI